MDVDFLMGKAENDRPPGVFVANYPSRVMSSIARRLRKNSTRSEELLWHALRRKQLSGLRFRRQQVFGSSVVDFYCHEKRLVIEIDGAIHLGRDMIEHDKSRQEIIELYGVKFLRFTADEVEGDINSVINTIRDTTNNLPSV